MKMAPRPLAQQPALNSPEGVKLFRKAAKAFTSRAVKSQASARKILIDEGIYTKGGKLTRQYR